MTQRESSNVFPDSVAQSPHKRSQKARYSFFFLALVQTGQVFIPYSSDRPKWHQEGATRFSQREPHPVGVLPVMSFFQPQTRLPHPFTSLKVAGRFFFVFWKGWAVKKGLPSQTFGQNEFCMSASWGRGALFAVSIIFLVLPGSRLCPV